MGLLPLRPERSASANFATPALSIGMNLPTCPVATPRVALRDFATCPMASTIAQYYTNGRETVFVVFVVYCRACALS